MHRLPPIAALAVAALLIAAAPTRGQFLAPRQVNVRPAPSTTIAPCPRCGRVHGGSGLGRLFGFGNADRNGYAPNGRSPLLTPSTYAPLADPTSRVGLPVNPYVGPNRLPRGQVYYGGRYFGTFNNRFYGPQYGYF